MDIPLCISKLLRPLQSLTEQQVSTKASASSYHRPADLKHVQQKLEEYLPKIKLGDGSNPGSGRMLEKRSFFFLLSLKFLLSGPILLQRVADVTSAS